MAGVKHIQEIMYETIGRGDIIAVEGSTDKACEFLDMHAKIDYLFNGAQGLYGVGCRSQPDYSDMRTITLRSSEVAALRQRPGGVLLPRIFVHSYGFGKTFTAHVVDLMQLDLESGRQMVNSQDGKGFHAYTVKQLQEQCAYRGRFTKIPDVSWDGGTK